MAADLHRILQRMDKQVPNRRVTLPRWWVLLALSLVLIGLTGLTFWGLPFVMAIIAIAAGMLILIGP